MRKKINRLLVYLLVLSLCFQNIPITSYATGLQGDNTVIGSEENSISETTPGETEEGETEESEEKLSEESAEESAGEAENDTVLPIETQQPNLSANGELSLLSEDPIAITSTAEFIALSNSPAEDYENATIEITRSGSVEFDLTEVSGGQSFIGLGSEEHPFAGSIVVTNGDISDIPLPINRSFFNYLDQKAQIGEGLYLMVKTDMNTPVLAEHYTNVSDAEDPGDFAFRVGVLVAESDAGGDTYYSFGGLIGEMAAGSSLRLSVKNMITDSGKTTIIGSGNLGFFCNTMGAGAELNIAEYTGDTAFSVTTTGGNAGGLVGAMEDGTILSITPDMALSGAVSTSAAGKFAGGLVGEAVSPEITINGNITETGSISGTSGTGGYIGKASYLNGEDTTVDLSSVSFATKLIGGNHTGGVFGVLNYGGGSVLTLDGGASGSSIASEKSGTTWQYGGVIGQYTSNSLAATLHVSNLEVTALETGSTSAYGGVIGFMAGSGAIDGIAEATPSYAELSDITVTAGFSGSGAINTSDGKFGGLIGEVGNQGHFVNITGKVTVKSSNALIGPKIGGLVGSVQYGIIRISGSTDLTDFKIGKSGISIGQLVGYETGTVTYAMGSGEGDGTSEYGWKLTRPAGGYTVSDVGTYGEIIRLNGVDLVENKRTGTTYITPGSDSTNTTEVFSFYTDLHTLVPYSNVAYSGDIIINNKRDMVTLAVVTQYGEKYSKGALVKYGKIGSDILGRTIKLETSVDLRGTGVTGLVRDNKTLMFTGTFDGNGNTITLAIGEQYAAIAGNEDGNGQIYDHIAPSFLGEISGATVKNVTFDGTINFGLPEKGSVEVLCGAVAGAARTATFDHVTVNTDIQYTGYDRIEMKNARVGGFVGIVQTDASVLSFKDCTSSGSITNQCGATEYSNGGFIGFVNATATAVSFKDCAIDGLTIDVENGAANITDAKVGGLIATMNDNAKTKTVSIDGLQIRNTTISGHNVTVSSGGLLGYTWLRTDVVASGIEIEKSSVQTGDAAVFGGLVYKTSGYWTIVKSADGTKAGIAFKKAADASANTLQGGSKAGSPSALLIAVTKEGSYATYIEIAKDAYVVEEDAVVVTLNSNGTYFDDIAGRTKYGDNDSSVVSIGLTELTAGEATKLDTAGCNSWHNKCVVNGSTAYINGNTRYYYNADYYRATEGSVTTVDSAGKMLLWSLYAYTSATANLSGYFPAGSTITGTIDLTGVSYYPVAASLPIEDAVITFDYAKMNGYESSNKPYNNKNLQHYQMHTGLFNAIKATEKKSASLSVKNLELKGDFGAYDASHAGILVCDTIAGYNATYMASTKIDGVNLNGIKCSTSDSLPLLINSIGSYTSTSLANVYTTVSADAPTKYTEGTATTKVACSLIGAVGSATGQMISLDFSDMALDARTEAGTTAVYGTYNSIFKDATFVKSFSYGDTGSGGSYNFESDSTRVTYGKEISNTASGRNNFNAGVTSQYCYFDTYGTEEYVADANGPGKSTVAIAARFATGYLPYVGKAEGADGKTYYHEIDVNQKAYFIVNGCGTYGHPWEIKNTTVPGGPTVAAIDQLKAIRDLLEGQGNGTVLMLDGNVLKDGKGTSYDHSTAQTATEDKLYIKTGGDWVEAELKDGRYRKKDGGSSVSDETVNAYVRNAYYQIGDDLEIDLSTFLGLGGNSTNRAFSGVIVGKENAEGTYPTITLKIAEGKSITEPVAGGLIRYSQGSVVKNLNIVFDKVTIPAATDYNTPTGFGGVIGWVIGGDNVIDNVTVSSSGISVTGDNNHLVAVGGYVGYIGGNDCHKGGGVIFRNINSAGLTTVGTTAVNTEVSAGNTKYYWNPYVGRVLDGYACTDEGYSLMGDNTNKNYKIPRLTASDTKTFTIVNKVPTNKSVDGKSFKYVTESSITIGSAQDLWVLASLVASGASARGTNDLYNGGTGTQALQNRAYYFGRNRIGHYSGIGTANAGSESDKTDEGAVWGGVGSMYPYTSYLASYTDNPVAAAFLAIDSGYRSLAFTNGTYDMTVYGNGFRGIGASFSYDGADAGSDGGSASYAQKIRVLRLAGNYGDRIALNGNGSTVKYERTIYEYANEPGENVTTKGNATLVLTPFTVKQAGLFPIFNQKNGGNAGLFKNLTINCTIQSNQMRDSSDAKFQSAFGGLYGRRVYNESGTAATVTFDNIKVYGLNSNGYDITNAYYAGGIGGSFFSKLYTPVITNCIVENFEVLNAVYAGGLIGDIENGTKNTEVTNCTVNNVTLADVIYAGGAIGYAKYSVYVNGGSFSNETISLRSQTVNDKLFRAGGVIGYVGVSLFLNNYGDSKTQIDTVSINASEINAFVGGVVGEVAEKIFLYDTDISKLYIVTKGNAGGVAGRGRANSIRSFVNCSVSDSKIALQYDGSGAGALIGKADNGEVQGFNVLSKNNLIGFLVNGTAIDAQGQTIKTNDKVDFSKLTADTMGKRTDSASYASYTALSATPEQRFFYADRIGIWVGDASGKKVSIVAASRAGECSAIRSVGYNAASSSYVIYADYSATAENASQIAQSPDTGIVTGDTKLTGDGAALKDGTPVVSTIIDETVNDKSWDKGYYGAEAGTRIGNLTFDRTLDAIPGNFDTSLISTYKTEEANGTYAAADGTKDFAILILQNDSAANISSLLKKYISILTNSNQTSAVRFISMTPQTYTYADGAWTLSQKQTMSALGNNVLKINSGMYDNTKNQITVIDVAYSATTSYLNSFGGSVASKDYIYHLYIPVLVKKVMDVGFTVQIVNGATGYESAYDSEKATLASYGEDFTAKMTFEYKWTALEWKNAIEGGDPLLWSFDKNVQLGQFKNFPDMSNMLLTVVNRNTHGTDQSFYQLKGTSSAVSVDAESYVTLSLNTAMNEKGVPICDLLPLKVSAEIASNPVEYKIVTDDSEATIRVWEKDSSGNPCYVYYALKDEANDAEGTAYYNISLDGTYADDEIVTVTEEYYVVINCKSGTQMYNNTVKLPAKDNISGQVPTKYKSNKYDNAVYALGDFYSINSLTQSSKAKIETSQEMKIGTNDTISVSLSSNVKTASSDFKKYVTGRAVYFRYALQMIDQNNKPVVIETAGVTAEQISVGGVTLQKLSDLSEAESGYTLEVNGSMCYITLKASGDAFIGDPYATVVAKLLFNYEDGVSLLAQFPTSDDGSEGVQFLASASMAYQSSSIGSGTMTKQGEKENKLYYIKDSSSTTLKYDSYNIVDTVRKDGNSSQLGINGRENNDASMEIKSRALYNASQATGLNRNDPEDEKYPYYLEGTLTLLQKNETDLESEVVGKEYDLVNINKYLQNISIRSENAADVSSDGLGAQGNSYKFRIQLTEEQVNNILSEQIILNINYTVLTGMNLEKIDGGKYGNYKVSLSVVLKDKTLDNTLTKEASDFLIYTNAKVYLGIIGITDVDSKQ